MIMKVCQYPDCWNKHWAYGGCKLHFFKTPAFKQRAQEYNNRPERREKLRQATKEWWRRRKHRRDTDDAFRKEDNARLRESQRRFLKEHPEKNTVRIAASNARSKLTQLREKIEKHKSTCLACKVSNGNCKAIRTTIERQLWFEKAYELNFKDKLFVPNKQLAIPRLDVVPNQLGEERAGNNTFLTEGVKKVAATSGFRTVWKKRVW